MEVQNDNQGDDEQYGIEYTSRVQYQERDGGGPGDSLVEIES